MLGTIARRCARVDMAKGGGSQQHLGICTQQEGPWRDSRR